MSHEPRQRRGTGPEPAADGGQAYAIAGEGIEVTYSDGTRAVRGVDLHIPRGEFFGFLGPNGAGKTTTIKTLATLLSPTGGEVRVNGFDVSAEARKVRESIGYMAQETSVDPELTARENIRFSCEAYGVPRSERADRIDELLDLADLADVADKEADEFSGGMKKRLDAATALVHRPPLVFLDEPTTGLDPKARNRLWDYFRRINDQGTTVFLTTQYLEEADQLCDRLSVIAEGEIVATGSPDELKRRVGGEILDIELAGAEGVDAGSDGDGTDADAGPRERAATVARETDLFTNATVETTAEGLTVTAEDARAHGTDLLVALRDAGIGVTGFNIRAPTLDDVFLAITGEQLDEADEADEDAAAAEVTT
ncbi:ABC transporter ATP-binding protein [Haloglomus halophilum]|uniref:ABC transporter ATP-binding protein n=1 Tax=Haloglomus halophilum TaxID=2962672 RepID=UPI0020C9BE7F|nr:ATP-binding cassette domain-containing protein [Haloglomus halophilum]